MMGIIYNDDYKGLRELEINDLIIFKTVISEGSISKAAKELGYVQPNVTERIKKLELEVGAPLLERTNKGVTPLPSGEILLAYTNQILNLIAEAKNEIKKVRTCYRIATTQSILLSYLHTRLENDMKDFEIYMEQSSQLHQLMKSNKVDMIISYTEYNDSTFRKVFSRFITIGLLKPKGKTNVDLTKEVFFVSHDQQCPYRNKTIQYLDKQHLSHTQLQQVDSYSLIKELVAQGKGLAFLPIHIEQLDLVDTVETIDLPFHFYTSLHSTNMIPNVLNS